jgi:hypothetical protein
MEVESLEDLQAKLAGLKRRLALKELQDEITKCQNQLAQKEAHIGSVEKVVVEILDDSDYEPVQTPLPKKQKQPNLLACWGVQVHIPQVGQAPRILMPNQNVLSKVEGLSCPHCESSTRIFPNSGSLSNHVKFAHPLLSSNTAKYDLKLDARTNNHGSNKRHSYTNETKMIAVQMLDADPKKSHEQIATDLGIPTTTVSKWLKLKDVILLEFLKSKKSKKGGKRSKVSSYLAITLLSNTSCFC